MPSIRNVLVNPEISLLSDEANGDGRRATLRTTGLMCSSL